MTPGAPPLSDRARPPLRISLTPLIDVVFILLVFFMLATNFLDWRAIRLGSASAGPGGTMTGALLVEVTPQGPRLAGAAVSLEALDARLAQAAGADPAPRVLVMPRGGVTTAALVAMLDRLDAAGVTRITLVEAPR